MYSNTLKESRVLITSDFILCSVLIALLDAGRDVGAGFTGQACARIESIMFSRFSYSMYVRIV